MKNLQLTGIVFGCALFVLGGAAQAEVQKYMHDCNGRLCPSFQLVLTPPHGWVIDQAASRRYKVQIIVPKGKNFSNAEALIYVKVSWRKDKQRSLADYARVSNERWRAAVPDAKISQLPVVERANGKPAFLRFAYENPSKAQQAYEVGAFGLDSDKDGNEFVLQLVMTGRAKKQLDLAEKDYIAFLKAH
jgi:hypothetical protein